MQAAMIDKEKFLLDYQTIRRQTETLCRPLLIEDYVIQGHPDVSPVKWHLAHTTWFFETFVLKPYLKNYRVFDPLFAYLFNSYYQSLGSQYPRVERGLLSRPSVEKTYAYRAYIDYYLAQFIEQITEFGNQDMFQVITLGLHHEQQHQELLITDIKYNFSLDPGYPAYHPERKNTFDVISPLEFLEVPAGVVEIGHHGEKFCFDNELPRHRVFLDAYAIGSRLVTNGEYLEFIEAGGYEDPIFWLSDGWEYLQKENWTAPLYWQWYDHEWHMFSLQGMRKLNLNEPVVHVSFYEALAYARYKNYRLPREAEWEHFVKAKHHSSDHGNFLEAGHFHPRTQIHPTDLQFFGDVWEWTLSPYVSYPGYAPLQGALGEYNGKFMCNQFVLRGGSCATPKNHIRSSYRNFFQPEKRWQFSGIRLAKDL